MKLVPHPCHSQSTKEQTQNKSLQQSIYYVDQINTDCPLEATQLKYKQHPSIHVSNVVISCGVYNNNNNNNNNNERIESRNSKLLQSPHCAMNCLQLECSSGQGAIVCKSCATHWLLTTFNMWCAMWYEGTAQLFSLTEFKLYLA